MSSSESEGEVVVPSTSHKRLVHHDAWKSVQRKKKRNSGESYVSQKGKNVAERKVGAPCKCPQKCYEKLDDEQPKGKSLITDANYY